MDIVLRTNTEVPYLALLGVERASASDYGARLVVRSRGFAGEQRVSFDRASLESFLEGVERMDRTLHGGARLRFELEESIVVFDVARTGAVHVWGELLEHSEFTHHLRFGFGTDQTCLAPLAAALRACLGLAVV